MSRKSNFELLRIIAMLLIISFHYCWHGGFILSEATFNNKIIKIFWLFGEYGVNLFMLLTGYFMIKKPCSRKKIIEIILEVQFYTIVTFLITCKLGINIFPNNFKQLIVLFMPIISNKYWYITAYFLICIFSPYINKFLNCLTKKEYKKFLLISLLFFSFIPTLFGIANNNVEGMLYYNRFIWLIVMYSLGGYIRKYGIKLINTKKKAFIYSFTSMLIMIVTINLVYTYSDFFVKIGVVEPACFWPPNTIFMLILSVSTFIFFEKLKLNYNVFINWLASTTLGVYIMHEGYLAQYLWYYLFQNKLHQNAPFLILHIIVPTFIIFGIGVIVDLIRQVVYKKISNKIINIIPIIRKNILIHKK